MKTVLLVKILILLPKPVIIIELVQLVVHSVKLLYYAKNIDQQSILVLVPQVNQYIILKILHVINALNKLHLLMKQLVNVLHVNKIMYGIVSIKTVSIKAVNKDNNIMKRFKFVCHKKLVLQMMMDHLLFVLHKFHFGIKFQSHVPYVLQQLHFSIKHKKNVKIVQHNLNGQIV